MQNVKLSAIQQLTALSVYLIEAGDHAAGAVVWNAALELRRLKNGVATVTDIQHGHRKAPRPSLPGFAA